MVRTNAKIFGARLNLARVYKKPQAEIDQLIDEMKTLDTYDAWLCLLDYVCLFLSMLVPLLDSLRPSEPMLLFCIERLRRNPR